jgi:hypothetical protein
MPLPDATKDQRIYQLLKNIDLGNLTFSEFQTAAQSVFAEPEAEDTLRRIVLVNLARMSVAGDWAGLTSAGGGAGGAPVLVPYSSSAYSADYQEMLHTSAPWGSNSNGSAPLGTDLLLWPFVASTTGTVSSMSVYVANNPGAGSTIAVGIYADSSGTPTSLMGVAAFDTSSSGQKTQTTFSASIALEAGTQYWYSYLSTAGAVPSMDRSDESGLPTLGVGDDGGIYFAGRNTSMDANVQTQADPIALSGITITNQGRLSVAIKY